MTLTSPSHVPRPPFKNRWLFHHNQYHGHVPEGSTWQSFYQYSTKRVLASLHCLITKDKANCSPDGNYGCMEISDRCDPGRFLQHIQKELTQKGVKSLFLILFPDIYDTDSIKRQREALQDNDYVLQGSSARRIIQVSIDDNEQLAANDWRSQAISIGDFRVTQEPLEQFSRIHRLISLSTATEADPGEVNTSLSLMNAFPEESFVFAVRDGAIFCALAYLIKVGPDVLYVNHYSQHEGYENNKPFLVLAQFVYEWAELHDLRLIDLGEVNEDIDNTVGSKQGISEHWIKKW